MFGPCYSVPGVCGVAVDQLCCMYPGGRAVRAELAAGQAELLFIEEKDGVNEAQAKAILYGRPGAPAIVGKNVETGAFMIPSDEQLDPLQLALVIAERLRRLGSEPPAIADRVSALRPAMTKVANQKPGDAVRAPYFCSGCRSEERRVGKGGVNTCRD